MSVRTKPLVHNKYSMIFHVLKRCWLKRLWWSWTAGITLRDNPQFMVFNIQEIILVQVYKYFRFNHLLVALIFTGLCLVSKSVNFVLVYPISHCVQQFACNVSQYWKPTATGESQCRYGSPYKVQYCTVVMASSKSLLSKSVMYCAVVTLEVADDNPSARRPTASLGFKTSKTFCDRHNKKAIFFISAQTSASSECGKVFVAPQFTWVSWKIFSPCACWRNKDILFEVTLRHR